MAGNFPKLQPAFTLLHITGGTIKSEPGFEPAVNAVYETGGDWIKADADGCHLRLDVRAIAKTDDGALLNTSYTGIMAVNPPIVAILTGAPNAVTTEFGSFVTANTFESGPGKYSKLENYMFVGTGRFIVNEDKSVTVEYKISRVLS
ncbi:hypothetical protein RUND412_010059 [Rhizina undulata]